MLTNYVRTIKYDGKIREHQIKSTWVIVPGLKDFRTAVRAELEFDLSKLETTNLKPSYYDKGGFRNYDTDFPVTRTYTVSQTVTRKASILKTWGSTTTVSSSFSIGGKFGVDEHGITGAGNIGWKASIEEAISVSKSIGEAIVTSETVSDAISVTLNPG